MAVKTDVLVVGGGPAGLSSAIWARKFGLNVMIVDENNKLGGQLIKQTHKFFGSKSHYCGFRGIDIAKILFEEIKKLKIDFWLNSSAIGIYNENNKLIAGIVKDEEFIPIEAKGIIVATGAQENMIAFENNDLPGIYGAGAVQTLVNVYGVMPGKNVLMVGSGNIGLIVSYQLMQAGIKVKAIVEALPRIGGYLVHASKVRRLGIPIYTSCTIKKAIGENKVEGAILVNLDENFNEILGSEKEISCDVICLSVGLSPSIELLQPLGCETFFIPELGGYVVWHNERQETNIEYVYVAGDAAGVEEAVSALLTGRIAGISCAQKITKTNKYEDIVQKTMEELYEFRQGHFGKKIIEGMERLNKALLDFAKNA